MRNTEHHRTTTDTRHASRQHTPVLPRTRGRRLPTREAAPTITQTGLIGKLDALARRMLGKPLSRLDSAQTISRLKSV